MSPQPLNTVRRGEPSRSAHRVACLRAVHALLDEPPVLVDPIALPLLGAATEAALRADPFALNDPLARGLRAALVGRSRFVEDELARQVAAGVRQYLVLGAGLDTFGCRNPHQRAGLRVFELDHAGTQQWKRQLLADARLPVPPTLHFVPADLERDDLHAALRGAGFRTDEPACVGWMGVSMYLTPEAVFRTLRAVAGLAAGSSLCFDHRVPPARLNPVDRVVDELIGQQAAAVGEPWLSAFDPEALQDELLALGFARATSVAPEEINARYFARRKDGLRVGGALRFMHAGIGAAPPA